MKFSYLSSPHLPPLAWVAVATPESSTIAVTHGRFVEAHSGFFVEGAWAGDF